MKSLLSNLKTIIFCFLVLISVNAQAQVINEGFEETLWPVTTTTLANQTLNLNTGTINTGSWMYNNAYVNTANAATFVRTGSNSFFLAGSSSAYICTPLIAAGVAQVTVVVKSATGTAASMVIGVATNTAVTANTGSISSTAAGAAWSVGSSCYTGLPVSTAGWTTITFTTNLTAPAYVKIQRVTTGSIYLDDITITGMVAVPTLTVAPATKTGFTYILGAGPSANQNFTVSGSNLSANATLTAPADYEIATVAGGPYSGSITLNQVAGNIALTTIYVRLKAGKAVGLYNGETITVASAGATTQNVTCSGSVTSGVLTPLPAPAVGAGSGISSTSFTANWSTVANASGGYIVNVYQGAALVKTVPVAGQASTNVIVNGLTASTAYTYKVIAVGDGLTYSNSPQSSASGVIVTAAPPAGGSCEITVYETNFSDWLALPAAGTSSTARTVVGGAGDGFIITEDTEIVPSTNRFNNTGTSGRSITYAPFDFSNGGTVYVTGYNNTGSSISGVVGATGVFDAVSGNPVIIGNVKNMAYNLRFDLPASVDGITALNWSSFRGYWSYMKICTNPTGGPQMATTNYQEAPAVGMSLTATIGGADASGIANVKAWNVTCGVNMSIVGADAALFELPDNQLTQAEALAGTPVVINFTPSVIPGVSNAQLKLTSTCGAPDFYMNIKGLTSSGAGAQITTPVQTWNFPTSLIAPITQDILISGANLTGPVTLTLGGADAAQFSLASNTVTLADALAGKPIAVTYLGGISSPLTQNATLTLSSPGAPNVVLPLVGLTYNLPPTMYTLDRTVTPAGTGIITQDLGGSMFAVGTTVRVTAIPQTGYKFKRWVDNGSTALTRSILMMSDIEVIAEFEVGTGPSVSPFNAYTPLVVGNTSFTARWGAATASTSYVVKVYNNVGTLVYTSPAQGGAVRSLNITGLTAGTQYTYTVTASTGDVSNIVGPVLTTGGSIPACGTVG